MRSFLADFNFGIGRLPKKNIYIYKLINQLPVDYMSV